MGPPELRGYLRAVARDLRDLGPFERRRVLREIKADLLELAAEGRAGSPADQEILAALHSTPEPSEVANTYLETLAPSAIGSRLAFVLVASLGALTLAPGVWILAAFLTSPQFWAAGLLILLVASALTLAGGVTLFAMGLAIFSPGRASPWRFAMLPAAATCLSVVAMLVMTAIAALGFEWIIAIGAFLIVFLGGAYALTYTHHQLPRLAEKRSKEVPTFDYFGALNRRLRDVDLPRRTLFLADLRGHAAAAGIESEGRASKEDYDVLVETLGSTTDVAEAYTRELRVESALSVRIGSRIAFAVAAVGIVIGTVILGIALSGAVPQGGYLTPFGLVGSVGLLGVSLAVLGLGLRVQRSPLKVPDNLVPIGTLAAAAALIISGVLIVAPSGGLLDSSPTPLYDVMASVPLDGGGLGVFWAAYPTGVADTSSFVAFPATGPPIGVWLTEVDADGTVRSTETFPLPLPYAPLLDLHRENDTWYALFANSVVSWGQSNEITQLTPASWYKVDGRLDGGTARVAWVSYSVTSGTLQVQFEKFPVTDYANGTRWISTLPLPALTDIEVTVAPEGVLVTILGEAVEVGVSRTWLSTYLLDETGSLVAETSHLDVSVPVSGIDDLGNGTSFRLDDAHGGPQGFWLVGRLGTTTNWTSFHRTWVAYIDSLSGSTRTWEIHSAEASRGPRPEQPGDESTVVWQESLAQADRLFVVSSIRGMVLTESGRRLDPQRSGLYLTTLLPSGEISRSARLGDAGDDETFIMPFLSAWNTTPTAFALPLRPDLSGQFSLRAYSVPELPLPIESTNVSVRAGEGALFYRLWVQDSATGFGASSGVMDFTGEAFVENPGFIGWRAHTANPSLAFVQVPAILRTDLVGGTTQLISLTPPQPPPDTLLEILATTSLTMAGVLSLIVAYPRWRLARSKNRQ